MKNKWLAAALNLIVGLGYIYLGGIRRVFGIMMLVSWVSIMLASIAFSPYSTDSVSTSTLVLGWFTIFMFVLPFVVDAFLEAQRINKERAKGLQRTGKKQDVSL